MTFGSIGSLGRRLCGQAPSHQFEQNDRIKNKKDFIAAVAAWGENGQPGEQRDVALARILDVFERGADYLDLSGLGLKDLPALPSLRMLDISNNALEQLPSDLPASLEKIDLRGNPLSPEAEHHVKTLLIDQFLPGYTQISSDTRRNWYEIIIGREKYADDFFEFLNELPFALRVKPAEFQQSVCEWLTQLAENDVLREKTFAIAFDATTTCADRILLTFDQMQTARFSDAVEKGHYDGKLPELVAVAREMFRQERLGKIASETISSLIAARLKSPMGSIFLHTELWPWEVVWASSEEVDARIRDSVDEVEIRLAFDVKLHRPLARGSAVKNMYFSAWSGLTGRDYRAAELRVKNEENQEFKLWLTHWSAWDDAVKRIDEPMHAEAEDDRHERLEGLGGDKLEQAIDAEIEREGLHALMHDEETRNGISKHLAEALSDDVKMALTDRFAETHGCRQELEPFWDLKTREPVREAEARQR